MTGTISAETTQTGPATGTRPETTAATMGAPGTDQDSSKTTKTAATPETADLVTKTIVLVELAVTTLKTPDQMMDLRNHPFSHTTQAWLLSIIFHRLSLHHSIRTRDHLK